MAEILGRYTYVGPYRIYYESAGEGRPIICFPTAGAPATEYRHFLEYFGERGYRAIAVDPPGHAHSYPDLEDLSIPGTADEFVDFIWDFTRTLKLDEEKPFFVGCAMTGSMMLLLAAKYGEKIGAVVAAEGNSKFRMDVMLLMLNHPSVNTGDFMQVATPSLCSRDLPCKVVNECIWHNARAAVPEAFQSELTIYDQFDVSARLSEIVCPVLHMYGDQDPTVSDFSVEDIRANVPNVKQVLVRDMGHIAPVDNPEGFHRAVEEFLSGLE